MEEKRFDSVELSQDVQRGITDLGYEFMTEIQAKAIPFVLEGRDVIGRSSTGTGKTAAFGLPAVEILRENKSKKIQVLAICPTRELAQQISNEVAKYAKYVPNVRLATVYGGESMMNQLRQLRTANFVIGTPGRIMDHMRRGTLKLDELKMVILDEADEMLNMGFLEDIQTILTEAPTERQTLLFSATMPPAIMNITKKFQNNPEIVAVDGGKRTIDTIKQYYYYVPQALKKDAINLVLQMNKMTRSVVFCNTKKMVDELCVYLNEQGHKSVGLHGDMKQVARTAVMQNFKNGRLQVLIATDVAARGIDVEGIEAVFNYDIPQDYEYYIHRIGRTGRAGKEGASYTFACNHGQVQRIREIKNYLKTDIKECILPTPEEFMKKSEEKLATKIQKALIEIKKNQYDTTIDALIAEGHTEKDIANALIGMLVAKDKGLAQMLKAVVPLQDEIRREKAKPMRGANRFDDKRGESRGRAESGKGFSNVANGIKLKVDIGRNQRIAPNFIVGAIVDATGISAKSIGKIDIHDDYSYVDLSAKEAAMVLDQMQGTTIRSCKVRFTKAAAGVGLADGDSKPKKKPFYNSNSGKRKPVVK